MKELETTKQWFGHKMKLLASTERVCNKGVADIGEISDPRIQNLINTYQVALKGANQMLDIAYDFVPKD